MLTCILSSHPKDPLWGGEAERKRELTVREGGWLSSSLPFPSWKIFVSDHSTVKPRKGRAEKWRQTLLSWATLTGLVSCLEQTLTLISIFTGFQELAQSLTIFQLWFPKPIQKNLYSEDSITLSTTHIIQISETDTCSFLQAVLYTRSKMILMDFLEFLTYLWLMENTQAFIILCHNKNSFLALAIRIVIQSFFSHF